jgi:predicted Zn-dependent peptidase
VLSVSSTRPDSAIAIMYHELDRMRRGEIDEKELESSKQVFITSLYMRQMTNSGLATALYSAQRNAGDWHRAFSLDAIVAVNKARVQRAVEKYARNLQVGIVGSREKVTVGKYLSQQP